MNRLGKGGMEDPVVVKGEVEEEEGEWEVCGGEAEGGWLEGELTGVLSVTDMGCVRSLESIREGELNCNSSRRCLFSYSS